MSLPRDLARRLRAEADRHDRSVSSVVREAVEVYLEGRNPPDLPSFAAIGASGHDDVSERGEEIIRRALGRGRRR